MPMDKGQGAGDERRVRGGATPAVGAGETTEQTVEHLLELGEAERLGVFEAVAVRILPRLDGVDARQFLESLRTVPRADARMDWDHPVERAESRGEVIEDVLNQPIGAQRRILELSGPRILSDLDQNRRDQFIRDLEAKLDLAAEGLDVDTTQTRH